jgi:LysR family transcriptional regulator for bpeEF and oprC
MDRLQAMKVFTRVAEMGSFSRAADALAMPRGSATIIIQQLEAHLRTRLLQRSTRRISLTNDGAAYYEHCLRILSDIDAVEHSLQADTQQPRGRLRIDLPSLLGRAIVMPALFQFHARYPDIELMVGMGDKPVDLIQDSVDCVIRIGALQDSSLVARHLGEYHMVTVASPDYLARHGTPHTLEELERHTAMHYFWGRNGRLMDLTFVVDGVTTPVRMQGKMAVNDTEAYMAGSLNGLGLSQSPLFMCAPYLHDGRLVEVLPQFKPATMPISAVYPHHRHLSPALRLFVDWAVALFADNDAMHGRAPVAAPKG